MSYLACQARAAGIDFTKDGNCYAAVAAPTGLARVADTLSQPATWFLLGKPVLATVVGAPSNPCRIRCGYKPDHSNGAGDVAGRMGPDRSWHIPRATAQSLPVPLAGCLSGAFTDTSPASPSEDPAYPNSAALPGVSGRSTAAARKRLGPGVFAEVFERSCGPVADAGTRAVAGTVRSAA
jgi:hypothetical protein